MVSLTFIWSFILDCWDFVQSLNRLNLNYDFIFQPMFWLWCLWQELYLSLILNLKEDEMGKQELVVNIPKI